MRLPNPALDDGAAEGAVFLHRETGAEVVLVDRGRDGGWTNVQLNNAEGHGPGWVSVLYDDAKNWHFVRWAE